MSDDVPQDPPISPDSEVGSAHEHDDRRLHGRHPRHSDAGSGTGIAARRDASPERRASEDNAEPLPIDVSGVQLDVHELVRELEVTRASAWSAPMPQPSVLAEYDRVLPGSAERILRAFEAVTTDAASRDGKLVDAGIWVRKYGTRAAIVFLAVLIVAAIIFFALGNIVAGTALLGAPLIIAIVSIITGAMDKDD